MQESFGFRGARVFLAVSGGWGAGMGVERSCRLAVMEEQAAVGTGPVVASGGGGRYSKGRLLAREGGGAKCMGTGTRMGQSAWV
eukprot:365124-Chlamydomonas_euryale.AAC.5